MQKYRLSKDRVSAYWQRVSPMPWSSYFNECLDILASNEGSPGDVQLAQTVRLQLILDKLPQTPWNDENIAEKDLGSKAPALPYVQALNAQLVDFKANLGSNMLRTGKLHPPSTHLVLILKQKYSTYRFSKPS